MNDTGPKQTFYVMDDAVAADENPTVQTVDK